MVSPSQSGRMRGRQGRQPRGVHGGCMREMHAGDACGRCMRETRAVGRYLGRCTGDARETKGEHGGRHSVIASWRHGVRVSSPSIRVPAPHKRDPRRQPQHRPACSGGGVRDRRSGITDQGSRSRDHGSGITEQGSRSRDHGSGRSGDGWALMGWGGPG